MNDWSSLLIGAFSVVLGLVLLRLIIRSLIKGHKVEEDKFQFDDLASPSIDGDPTTDAPSPTTAFLIITQCYDQKLVDKVISLKTPVTSLGRSASNDFSFPEDRMLSRSHAVIEHKRNSYFLTDLNSSFGTYLNGAKVRANEKVLLSNEDYIKMGKTVLVIRYYEVD